MQVDVENCEHEAEIGGHGRLPGEEELDPLLDPHVALVDVVVEGDHLVRELLVALLECVDRTAEGAQDKRPLLLQRRLEQGELVLERRSHPNLPVT